MSNVGERPRTNGASQPTTIDVLSQEVEEMEMNDQKAATMEYAHNHPQDTSSQSSTTMQVGPSARSRPLPPPAVSPLDRPRAPTRSRASHAARPSRCGQQV